MGKRLILEQGGGWVQTTERSHRAEGSNLGRKTSAAGGRGAGSGRLGLGLNPAQSELADDALEVKRQG